MMRVEINADDMARGKAGDCFECAAALALQRDTGDHAANVYFSIDGPPYVEAHGRHVIAPHELASFVSAYDALPRDEDGHPILGDYRNLPPEPIAFDLPDLDSGEWEERCYLCEELFDPAELDDEGVCRDCQQRQEANP